MKKLTLSETQDISLAILKSVHDFCATRQLRYSLACGTLIGAIRHKGFIPWDDDIDISMPREDYEVFIKEFKSPHYEVLSYHSNKKYYLPYAKVVDDRTLKIESVRKDYSNSFGIGIDVFPIDNCESENDYKLIRRKQRFLVFRLICSIRKPDHNILKNLVAFFLKGNANELSRRIDLIGQSFNNRGHTYMFQNDIYADVARTYPGDLFLDLVPVPFQGQTFFVYKNFDKALRIHFGDYMVLPPADQRVATHGDSFLL